ncbi:hypothetical protein NPIL_331191, partial [Nephila pilipes]
HHYITFESVVGESVRSSSYGCSLGGFSYLWLGIVKAAEPSMEPSLQNLSGVVWKFGESGLVNLDLKEISFYERLARFHGKKKKMTGI